LLESLERLKSVVASSWLILSRRYPPLELTLLVAPLALHKLQDCPDLIVVEFFLERRHLRVICRIAAVGNDADKKRVGMVPGVTRTVMRRRRQGAVWQALLPICRAFQVRAVTPGTVLRVK